MLFIYDDVHCYNYSLSNRQQMYRLQQRSGMHELALEHLIQRTRRESVLASGALPCSMLDVRYTIELR